VLVRFSYYAYLISN